MEVCLEQSDIDLIMIAVPRGPLHAKTVITLCCVENM